MPQQPKYAAIAQENVLLQGKVNELERQVAWFQKQVFSNGPQNLDSVISASRFIYAAIRSAGS